MTARNNINNLVMADIKVSLLFGEAQLWRILNLYQCGDWLDVIGGDYFSHSAHHSVSECERALSNKKNCIQNLHWKFCLAVSMRFDWI